MMKSNVKRNNLYENREDFYKLNGNAIMKLTPRAAKNVCQQSLSQGYIVSRIEGGIWHNPGFEMRLDCIWDRPVEFDLLPEKALIDAIEFLDYELEEHNAFIVSLQKI